MERALAQARLAAARGEVPVGAVLLHDGRILAESHNLILTERDPTAHAEMIALRKGAQVLGNERLVGATLVVTLEPCPMCLGAAILARIDRLVYAASDPKSGAAGSVFDLARSERLNHRIEVVSGLRSKEAAEVLREFFLERRRGAGEVERARLEIG